MTKTIRTGNPELIRDINTQSVIRTIMEQGPISRAAISGLLGLTKATVSAIVQVLLSRGLVQEIDPEKETAAAATGKKGRRPILLRIDPCCGHIISVDLGADTVTVMSSNLVGGDCRVYQYPFPERYEYLIALLTDAIRSASDALPESRYGLLGIALSIHGVVHHNRIIFLPYSSYETLDLATPLSRIFQVPVLMENEANLSVLGEWFFCHKTNEMLYISVHSGIGVGIIMRDQLVKGKNGYAGEFGHTIVEPDGRPCPCGNHGCLEQYASERAIFAEMSRLKERQIRADEFEALYRDGDADAHRLVETFIRYMSIGINNLLNTFNPDIIVLNSVLSRCRPTLCEDISRSLHNKMKDYCHLVPSTLQDSASLLGGAYLVQNRFLYPNQI